VTAVAGSFGGVRWPVAESVTRPWQRIFLTTDYADARMFFIRAHPLPSVVFSVCRGTAGRHGRSLELARDFEVNWNLDAEPDHCSQRGKRFGSAGKSRFGLSPRPGLAEFLAFCAHFHERNRTPSHQQPLPKASLREMVPARSLMGAAPTNIR